MAGRILKGLAVAAGTGLAIGLGGERRRIHSMSTDNIPAIEPLLERLDRIEARITVVESSKMDLLEATLEATLLPHVENLRARLHAEMLEAMETALAAFEKSIDSKVSIRVSTLEKALIDQSAIVTALSERAIAAEENFQKLISAVERLCERTEPATLSRPARPVFELPFDRPRGEAFQLQPAPSALPADSGFRPRIIQEEDDDKRRHRRRLTGI